MSVESRTTGGGMVCLPEYSSSTSRAAETPAQSLVSGGDAPPVSTPAAEPAPQASSAYGYREDVALSTSGEAFTPMAEASFAFVEDPPQSADEGGVTVPQRAVDTAINQAGKHGANAVGRKVVQHVGQEALTKTLGRAAGAMPGVGIAADLAFAGMDAHAAIGEVGRAIDDVAEGDYRGALLNGIAAWAHGQSAAIATGAAVIEGASLVLGPETLGLSAAAGQVINFAGAGLSIAFGAVGDIAHHYADQ